MSSAGCRGAVWSLVLAVSGCGAAPHPSLKVVEKPAPKAVVSAPLVEPSLTPAPSATPDSRVDIDFKGLLQWITAGTDVHLQASSLSRLWPVQGLDFERPISSFGPGDGSGPSVFLASLTPGARVELAPSDEAFTSRGLKLIKSGGCALREDAPGGAVLACGKAPLVQAFAGALVGASALPSGALVHATIGFGSDAGTRLEELRNEVPRQIDPLVPQASVLAQAPLLRAALLDEGFELVGRLMDAYATLTPLKLGLLPAAGGKLSLSVGVEPRPDSLAARIVERAKPAHFSSAFWQLSEHTESAWSVDASAIRPLFEPSPRALALLSQAQAGGALVTQLASLPSACLEPGRSLVVASGRRQEDPTAARVWPPEPPTGSRRDVSAMPSYSLLGVEDPKGGCGKALSALLTTYETLAPPPEPSQKDAYFRVLPTHKPLPKDVKLFAIGHTDDVSYVGVAARPGALWIARSTDLPLLEATLGDLVVPSNKRRGLKARPELAHWGAEAALLSGFVREDALPLASLLDGRGGVAASRASVDDSKLRRVPYALLREGAALRVNADIETATIRRLMAKAIGDSWSSRQFAQLPVAQREVALQLLDGVCHLGEANACNLLGVIYGDGRGVEANLARCTPYLELGCEQGSGTACANLAFYRKAERAEELKLFQKGCELNAPLACAWWGVRLLEHVAPGEERAGLEKLQMGCDGNIGFACARIGAHYREGLGLPQDPAKGADFHERSCLLALGVGCVDLAEAYLSGKGRAHDEQQAFDLLQKACELDKAEGCYALGLAYLTGRGAKKDPAAASEQLNVACAANHAEACRALAELAGEP